MNTRALVMSLEAWRAWEELAQATGHVYSADPVAPGVPTPTLHDLLDAIGRDRSLMAQMAYWLTPTSPKPPLPADPAPDADGPLIIIRPRQPLTATIAYVRYSAESDAWRMAIVFREKRDDFRDVVRACLYSWQSEPPAWIRRFALSVNPVHRAAEICHRLLLAGFCVSPPSAPARDLTLDAEYTPESRRWITAQRADPGLGWFVFHWWRSEDCYQNVMRLTAARYVGGAVLVPVEHVDEVLDFANANGFTLTATARELAQRAQAWLNTAMLVDQLPALPGVGEDSAESLILTEPDGGIAPDLLDDET